MAETTTPKKRGRKAAAAGQPVTQEVVVMVPLAELHPFPDHPFQVRDDESMRETAASVKENGVIIPGLVRPREEGGYEIIAGHRRKHACELAGLTAMPVIVRDMDRDSATVVMVDSNLQRESILPSERAKAYKMKLDAIKRRAGRPSKDEQENAPNVSANFRSDDEVGQDAGVSGDTIRNYISYLIPLPGAAQEGGPQGHRRADSGNSGEKIKTNVNESRAGTRFWFLPSIYLLRSACE